MLLAGPISHTSTQYIDFVDFLRFNGSVYQLFSSFYCVLSFLCVQLSLYPRMLCHVFWSQVEYKIVCFISGPWIGSSIDSKSSYIMNGTLNWNCPSECCTIGFLCGISTFADSLFIQ